MVIRDKETNSVIAENAKEAYWLNFVAQEKRDLEFAKSQIKAWKQGLKKSDREIAKHYREQAKANIKQTKEFLKYHKDILEFAESKVA